jgi:hypothetical protein
MTIADIFIEFDRHEAGAECRMSHCAATLALPSKRLGFNETGNFSGVARRAEGAHSYVVLPQFVWWMHETSGNVERSPTLEGGQL